MTKKNTSNTNEEFMKEFNREMQKGSDRAIVLITGAMIDDLLLRLLKKTLLFHPENMFEGGNAILGTWSARSAMARALGLVSNIEYRQLKLMRIMRNDMAHELALNLSDDKFTHRIREMFTTLQWEELNSSHELSKDNRILFAAAGLMLINILTIRIDKMEVSPISEINLVECKSISISVNN